MVLCQVSLFQDYVLLKCQYKFNICIPAGLLKSILIK